MILYKLLDHIEETNFLINKIREIIKDDVL